jgi:hypothetical protein
VILKTFQWISHSSRQCDPLWLRSDQVLALDFTYREGRNSVLGLFRFIPYFLYTYHRKLNLGAGKNAKTIMENSLVRRDQFNISPQGIIHTPTDAAFTPHPGDPYSGILRMGQFGNKHPNGSGFNFDDVERLMRELWAEYVACNPHLFET